MNGKEIIDLTASEDREVIILDSDGLEPSLQEERTHKHAVTTQGGDVQAIAVADEDTVVEAVETEDRTESGKKSKRKKARRSAKKRKRELEDGEIVNSETMEDSVQASREDSGNEQDGRDATSSGSTPKVKKQKSKDTVKGERSLIDRLSDIAAPVVEHKDGADEDDPGPDAEDDSTLPRRKSRPSRTEKKRKRREKAREREREDKEWETTADSALFFFDDQPPDPSVSAATITLPPPQLLAPEPAVAVVSKSKDSAVMEEVKLLLPAHVSVVAAEGESDMPVVEIIAPIPVDSDDEDYIDYLDYDDDRKVGLVRYFDDVDEVAEAKAAKATRIVCKRCGAEGEHKTYDCPVLICLTCGARDEHGTRSCPISKTCFTCGMRGHINRDCPNRYSRGNSRQYDDCDRCGSTVHQEKECPTIWRIYEYVDDAERKAILEAREKKRLLEIGEGGEGYIGPEDWCYNCGGFGHLGDDCKELPGQHPAEKSAFSEHNTRSGPFSDAKRESRPKSKAVRYAEQAEEAWGDGHGAVLPLDVGRQGKQKEKARMEKRAREYQEDEGDDWFAKRAGGPSTPNGRGPTHSGRTPKGSRNDRSGNKKISFGNIGQSDRRYDREEREERDRDRDRNRRNDRGGRDGRDKWRDERDDRREREYWNGLPEPMRETDSIQIRGASKKGGGDWGVSIRGAASRHDDWEPSSRDELHEERRHERSRSSRDKYDSRREGSPRREPRWRGGYSR